jgi:hypothetical protein
VIGSAAAGHWLCCCCCWRLVLLLVIGSAAHDWCCCLWLVLGNKFATAHDWMKYKFKCTMYGWNINLNLQCHVIKHVNLQWMDEI